MNSQPNQLPNQRAQEQQIPVSTQSNEPAGIFQQTKNHIPQFKEPIEQTANVPSDQIHLVMESEPQYLMYDHELLSHQQRSKGYFSLVEYSSKRERDNRGRFLKDKTKPKGQKGKSSQTKYRYLKQLQPQDIILEKNIQKMQQNSSAIHDQFQSTVLQYGVLPDRQAPYSTALGPLHNQALKTVISDNTQFLANYDQANSTSNHQASNRMSAHNENNFNLYGQSHQFSSKTQSGPVDEANMKDPGLGENRSGREFQISLYQQPSNRDVNYYQLHNQNKNQPHIHFMSQDMKDQHLRESPHQPGQSTLIYQSDKQPLAQDYLTTQGKAAFDQQSSQMTFGNDDKINSNIREQLSANQQMLKPPQALNAALYLSQKQSESIEIDQAELQYAQLEIENHGNQSPPQANTDNLMMHIQSSSNYVFGPAEQEHSDLNEAQDQVQPESLTNNQLAIGSHNTTHTHARALNIDAEAAQKYIENQMNMRRIRTSPHYANSGGLENINTSSGAKMTMRTRNQGRKGQDTEDIPSHEPTKAKVIAEDDKQDQSLVTQQLEVQNESNKSPKNSVVKDRTFDSVEKDLQLGQIQSTITQNEDGPKAKKSGQNLFEDCLKIYQKMFWFNWDLKEITNSRHSPSKYTPTAAPGPVYLDITIYKEQVCRPLQKEELSAGAFWFYINTTYFPYELLETMTKKNFEEWVYPIENNINTFRFKNNVAFQQDQSAKLKSHIIQYHSKIIDQLKPEIINLENQFKQGQNVDVSNMTKDHETHQKFSHVEKLIGKRKKFNRFRQHLTHLNERAGKHHFDSDEIEIIQEKAKKIPKLDDILKDESLKANEKVSQDAELEVAIIKEKIEKDDFQKMLMVAEKDLETIQNSNFKTLKHLFLTIKDKFEAALIIKKSEDGFFNTVLYKGEDIGKQMPEFFGRIEPAFVQDMVANKEWYQVNMNKYLLNINYPCKLQTECLKEMELLQQRRNDQKYRKILDQMDQIDQIKQLINQGDYKAIEDLKQKEKELGTMNLNQYQRSQIAQEDALCAICGIGDFEDNDQIVFCFICSMPVHQSCFGLEVIPETDWVCNNCATYQLQRGLMIKCMLCPKKGGAMKPTNVFSSYEKFYDQKRINMTKKHGKKSMKQLEANKPELIQQQNLENNQNLNDMSKSSVMQRIEPYTSLNELLIREEAYFKKTLMDYDDRVTQIELAKMDPILEVKIPELCEYMLVIKVQEDLELNFNKHEIQNHKIPEDYSNFIKRNQALLEVEAPPTDTLYHWVHHSCAMWMKEPIVTPKTSVNMKRLDFNRFNQGCFICCKKGPNVGACVKCCKTDCQVFFHVECAKRANYCMEIEKKGPNCSNRERVFKIFCESHRPFKILQVINEQNQKEIDDIQKFTKTIERSIDIQKKHLLKPKKVITKSEKNKMLRQALQNKKQELIQLKKDSKLMNKPKKEKRIKPTKVKKWTKNDIKTLMNRVKEKYLDIMRMRINLVRIDPMIAETKRYQKEMRRIQKQEEKRKKQEFQLKQKEVMINIMNERESKVQERGLRNRFKANDDERLEIDQWSFEGGKLNEEEDQELQNKDIDISDHLSLEELSEDNLMDIDDPEGLCTDEQLCLENIGIQNQSVMKHEFEEPNFQIQTIGSYVTNPNKITLNLQSGAEEPDSNSYNIPKLQEIPEFYKHATPSTFTELEWTVTLSRYDFPWNEISFGSFTAKDCYKMFRLQVADPDSFLKKVLGDKVQKYQKMMYNQINGMPLYTMINLKMTKQARIQVYSKQAQGSKNQLSGYGTFNSLTGSKYNLAIVAPPGGTAVSASAPRDQLINYSAPIPEGIQIINPFLYCKCRGMNTQEFMVCCESGEDNCNNGGWLHPECTRDLKHLTQEQIDAIEVWYCEDCQDKINKTNNTKKKGLIKEIKIKQQISTQDKKRASQPSVNQSSRLQSKPQTHDSVQKEVIKFNNDSVLITSPLVQSPGQRKTSLIITIDHDNQQNKNKDVQIINEDMIKEQISKQNSPSKLSGRLKVELAPTEKNTQRQKPQLVQQQKESNNSSNPVLVSSQEANKQGFPNRIQQQTQSPQHSSQVTKTAQLGFLEGNQIASQQQENSNKDADSFLNLMRAIGQATTQIQQQQQAQQMQQQIQQQQQNHFAQQQFQQQQNQGNSFESQIAQLISNMYGTTNEDANAPIGPQVRQQGLTQNQFNRLNQMTAQTMLQQQTQHNLQSFQPSNNTFIPNQNQGNSGIPQQQQHHNQLSQQQQFQQHPIQQHQQQQSSSSHRHSTELQQQMSHPNELTPSQQQVSQKPTKQQYHDLQQQFKNMHQLQQASLPQQHPQQIQSALEGTNMQQQMHKLSQQQQQQQQMHSTTQQQQQATLLDQLDTTQLQALISMMQQGIHSNLQPKK